MTRPLAAAFLGDYTVRTVPRIRKARFDAVELLLVATLVGLAAWSLASSLRPYRVTYGDVLTRQEYSRLKERYGPGKHSEHEEE
ncbi:MAG: hypothetical protein ACE148_16210 [Vicinamibacterales bacterium]